MKGLRYPPLHVTEFCGEMQGKFKVGLSRLISRDVGKQYPNTKAREIFRFITIARLCNFIMHEHKLYKFGYLVPLNHGKYFVRILKRDPV